MATVNVIYPPIGSGNKFDMDYYRKFHMPMVQSKWGPHGLRSWQVVQFGPDAAYSVQAILDFESLAAFQAASASPEAKDVFDDISNYTDLKPLVLAGDVVFNSN